MIHIKPTNKTCLQIPPKVFFFGTISVIQCLTEYLQEEEKKCSLQGYAMQSY
jgi:hypothetical protein